MSVQFLDIMKISVFRKLELNKDQCPLCHKLHFDDILLADSGDISMLLLLNIRAAFDSIVLFG